MNDSIFDRIEEVESELIENIAESENILNDESMVGSENKNESTSHDSHMREIQSAAKDEKERDVNDNVESNSNQGINSSTLRP